jgi:restriction system protein
MTRKYYYSQVVFNKYLGVSKEVKGATPTEVEFKVAEQLRKWQEQERRGRERDRIADLKQQAEFDTQQAQQLINSYQTLLQSTLSVDDRLNWESLKDDAPFDPFSFDEDSPSIEAVAEELGVPRKRRILESLAPFMKKKRLQKEAEAEQVYSRRLQEYQIRLDNARTAYEQESQAFERKQQEYNDSLAQLRAEFELCHGDAVEKYVYMVLERSRYPEGLEQVYELEYDPLSEILVVSYELPPRESVPRIVEHRYVASKKATVPIEMKPKEFEAYYEDALYQICLRTIHEIFESVYVDAVKSVVFNGWVSGVDSKTGTDFRSCIMSCQAPREEFESLNLGRVSARDCFRHLKGLSAGPLAQLAPVRPIMDLRRDDKRFVESRDVTAGMVPGTNLATIDWADFEHLVRELFEEEFAREGGEVRVTQASRDGGVDAIAFDPDPLRGGKFVIQAKRYNNVVPVSAVRDLYGTVINEGATKGILVTTSYYGNDSREFAKDKPIQLIDGPNLMYLFQKHGRNVTIELQGKSQ